MTLASFNMSVVNIAVALAFYSYRYCYILDVPARFALLVTKYSSVFGFLLRNLIFCDILEFLCHAASFALH